VPTLNQRARGRLRETATLLYRALGLVLDSLSDAGEVMGTEVPAVPKSSGRKPGTHRKRFASAADLSVVPRGSLGTKGPKVKKVARGVPGQEL
jgi:hypothetical protein